MKKEGLRREFSISRAVVLFIIPLILFSMVYGKPDKRPENFPGNKLIEPPGLSDKVWPAYKKDDTRIRETTADKAVINRLDAAWDYYLKGELDKSIRTYDQVLKMDQNSIEANFMSGTINYEWGYYDKAGYFYMRTIELSPSHCHAYNGMGWIKSMQNDHKDASSYFGRALELCPNDKRTLSGKGWNHYYLGEFRQATEYLSRSYYLDNHYWPAVMGLVLSHDQLNAWPSVIEFSNKAEAIGLQGFWLYRAYAKALIEIGEYSLGKHYSNLAVLAEPTSVSALLLRARASYWLAEYDSCIADARSVLAMDSNNPYGIHLLANALCAAGKKEEALVNYDYLLEHHTDYINIDIIDNRRQECFNQMDN